MKKIFCCFVRGLLGVWLLLFGIARATAQSGPALSLDGVDDYASVVDNNSLDLGSVDGQGFTIEAWFYVPDLNGEGLQTLIYKQNAYALFINFHTAQSEDILFRIWASPISTDYYTLSGVANIGVGWHHIAAIFDNQTGATFDLRTIYLDGTSVASSSARAFDPGINSSSSALNIGAYLGTNPFKGWIDEVRLSDVVRYTGASHTVPVGGFTPDANTRVLWHFDEIFGSTEFADASGNSNVLSGLNGAVTSSPPTNPPPSSISEGGTVVAWGTPYNFVTAVPATLTNAIAVAAGYLHSVALRSDGTVVAWGNNAYGSTSVPLGLSNVVAISAGYGHTLALQVDGRVAAWGFNGSGESSVPAGLTNVIAVSARGGLSLALKSDGKVIAWGANGVGQASVPAGLSNVVAIAAGGNRGLALKSDGSIVLWGLVVGNPMPLDLTNVVAIAAGQSQNLALRRNGTISAWGESYFGEGSVPTGLSDVIAIAAGSYHSLVLRWDGTVFAWGQNNNGQATVPSGLSGVVAIAGGQEHSVALNNMAAAPKLKIKGTDSVSIGWPDWADGYRLETTPSMGVPTDWISITNLAWSVSGQKTVVLPNAGSNAFFRLSKQ